MEKIVRIQQRVQTHHEDAVMTDGSYILYVMMSARRTRHNYGLERAVEWSNQLGKPLLVLEALSIDYPWASQRHHRFIIDGMRHNAQTLRERGIAYYPYVEPSHRHGRGLIAALGSKACVVVTDDFPCFFLPKVVKRLVMDVGCRIEVVDSNGVIPMRLSGKSFSRAHDFRRFVHKNLPAAFEGLPLAEPLDRLEKQAKPASAMQQLSDTGVDAQVLQTWPPAKLSADLLQTLTLDTVAALPQVGGSGAASEALDRFVNERLPMYAEKRNRPEHEGTSRLSPYLHFGHLSSVEIVLRILDAQRWSPDLTKWEYVGRRSGFWGAAEPVEAFLDQVITWRELGYVFCAYNPDYDQYDSLPPWAIETLRVHASDPREHVYSMDEFERGLTHDALWNAAQMQLQSEGRIHNYLRMLWGKKILHWSANPRAALDTMVHLNNKYALDGRNPNSYSGIFWTLGRFDRAWGPERPIFGKVRYMTSESTARKFRTQGYVQKYSQSQLI